MSGFKFKSEAFRNQKTAIQGRQKMVARIINPFNKESSTGHPENKRAMSSKATRSNNLPNMLPPPKIRISPRPTAFFFPRGSFIRRFRQLQTQRLSGFSLIEILIAMSITFFLLVGLAEMLCYSLWLKQKAEFHRTATDIISEKIETFKSLGPEDQALLPGNYREIIKDKNSDRMFLLEWEISEENNNLKKILLKLYPGTGKESTRPPTTAAFFLSESLQF